MPPASPRLRPSVLWTLFTVFALGATALVVMLFHTADRSLRTEIERALERERANYLTVAEAYLIDTRLSIIAELAGFHEEGLAHTLSRWDEANATVIGTFVLPAGTDVPPGIDSSSHDILNLDVLAEPGLSRDLGYQAENLENVRYAGREVRPVAAWAAHRTDPDAPWLIWYRTGPAEPVRGATIAIAPLVNALRGFLPDPTVVSAAVSTQPAPDATILPELPAHRMTFTPGSIGRERQQTTRLVGAAAFLFLGALLASAAMLMHRSQRDLRDALRKTTFVSLVSHELRTPVTSIRMFADMLADPAVSAQKRAKFTATIQRESARLGHLIERLLTFSALEKQQPAPPRRATELTALLRETVDAATPPLHAAGLTPELALPDAPVSVETDAESVRQAVLNLLDNAAKYAPGSGLLRITLRRDETHARIQVIDQGPGVPSAARERIFEAFVQGHDQLTDKQPGLGLGLALSRAILHHVGAELSLLPASSREPGATFEIRLPLV